MSSYYYVSNPYVVCLTEKDQRNIYKDPTGANKKNITKQNRNDKKNFEGATTEYTCQKKIEEGHSIERVWYNASRESSDTFPGSQPCTQTRSVDHNPYSQGVGCQRLSLFVLISLFSGPRAGLVTVVQLFKEKSERT